MPRKNPRSQKPVPTYDITIVSGIQETYLDSEKGVQEDLELARSALLYSDHVHLYSLTAAILEQFRAVTQQPSVYPLKFVLDNIRNQPTQHGAPVWLDGLTSHLDQYIEILSKTNRAQRRKLGPDFLRLERSLLSMSNTFRRTQADMWESHGGLQIDEAVRAGQLTIHSDWANDLFLDGDLDEGQFLHVLQSHITDTGGSLLFDSMMGGIVTAASKEQKLSVPLRSRHGIRRTKTGTAMIAYLPTFAGADIGDILDAKTVIRTPLSPYQEAVKKLEHRISATASSDEDVDEEITFIWHDHVEPRIKELHEAFGDTPLPRLTAATKGAVKGVWPPGAIFMAGTAAAEHTELTSEDIAHVASFLEPLGLGLYVSPEAAGAATLAWGVKRAYDGWRSADKAIRDARRDGLFYLVDTQRALGRSRLLTYGRGVSS